MENSKNDTIDDFIKNRKINKHFTPRDIEKELKSRNCQKIQRSIRDEIIKVSFFLETQKKIFYRKFLFDE